MKVKGGERGYEMAEQRIGDAGKVAERICTTSWSTDGLMVSFRKKRNGRQKERSSKDPQKILASLHQGRIRIFWHQERHANTNTRHKLDPVDEPRRMNRELCVTS